MACHCYHAERNFIGKIGVCWGTRECDACSCGGDESKCDFYEDKRKKATPKTTNADRIRTMSDEELAKHLYWWDNSPLHASSERWLEWLRQEAVADAKLD